MPRKWKDDSGSSLVWAIAVAGFLLIVVSAVLSVSLSFSKRSMDIHKEQQAYLTARSGVDLITQEFVTGSSNSEKIYYYLEAKQSWSVSDVGFEEDMGTCSIEAQLLEPETPADTKRTILVTATGTVDGCSRTISATLVGVVQREGTASAPEESSGEEDGTVSDPTKRLTWYVSAYTDGGKEAASS